MSEQKTPALATEDEAAELLGAEELGEAVAAGTVRRVQYDGGTFYLGADLAKLQRESDPRRLASRIRRPDGSWPATDPDDDDQDSPRAIAARIPRF